MGLETIIKQAQAAVKGEDPAMPVEPMEPAEPAEPDEAAPRYKEGDSVMSSDPARGACKVKAVNGMEWCYMVTAANGMDYIEPESCLQAGGEASAPVPVAPEPQSIPGAILAALALGDNATEDDALSAINALVGDKSVAMAGVKTDLRDLAEGQLERKPGQTWQQAGQALRAARPSLFETDAPVATKEQAKDEKPADVKPAAKAESAPEPIKIEPIAVPKGLGSPTVGGKSDSGASADSANAVFAARRLN